MRWLRGLLGSGKSKHDDSCACSLHSASSPEEAAVLAERYGQKLHDAYLIAIEHASGDLRTLLESGRVASSMQGASFTAAYIALPRPDGKRRILGYTWDFIEAHSPQELASEIIESTRSAE